MFLNVSDIVKYKLILIKITVINNNQLQKLHVLFFRFLSTGGSYRSSTFSYNSTILLTVRDIWKATLETFVSTYLPVPNQDRRMLSTNFTNSGYSKTVLDALMENIHIKAPPNSRS